MPARNCWYETPFCLGMALAFKQRPSTYEQGRSMSVAMICLGASQAKDYSNSCRRPPNPVSARLDPTTRPLHCKMCISPTSLCAMSSICAASSSNFGRGRERGERPTRLPCPYGSSEIYQRQAQMDSTQRLPNKGSDPAEAMESAKVPGKPSNGTRRCAALWSVCCPQARDSRLSGSHTLLRRRRNDGGSRLSV